MENSTQIVMDYFYDSFVVIFGDWQSVLSFTFITWECSSKKSVLQNEHQMDLEQHKGEQKKKVNSSFKTLVKTPNLVLNLNSQNVFEE